MVKNGIKFKRINTKIPIFILYEFKGVIAKKNITYTDWLKLRMQSTIDDSNYLKNLNLVNEKNITECKNILAVIPEDMSNKLRGLLVANGLRFDLWLINEMKKTVKEDETQEM
jgi:filamentous hemagglutinin family protein